MQETGSVKLGFRPGAGRRRRTQHQSGFRGTGYGDGVPDFKVHRLRGILWQLYTAADRRQGPEDR